jgi:energy-converting hydrogenase A subunit R
VASTAFPTDLTARLGRSELDCINAVEQTILGLRPGVDDDRIKIVLDRFFWRELPGTPVGKILRQVKPIGGERKVTALNRFAEKYRQPVREWAVVGDSITDFKMLRTVNQSGGLAIAFNANEYALPHATIGLASTSLYPLREGLYTWKKGDRDTLESLIRENEERGGHGRRQVHFQWLDGRQDISQPLEVHRNMRYRVRKAAAALG